MKFGPVALAEAEGAVLAHSVRLPDSVFKKGRRLSAADIDRLRAAGHRTVTAARLEADDVGEDRAAARIAAACHGDNVNTKPPFIGRCNLVASADGLLVIDEGRVDRLNQVDEAATLATLHPFQAVRVGQMVATVKIITFGVSETVVERCAAVAIEGQAQGLVGVAAFRPVTVGLIQTRLPGIKESIIEKAVETTQARLADYGAGLAHDLRCDHDEDAVAAALAELRDAGCDIALVLGASATVDRRDVAPAAVERAGGEIEHFGMPVDPGTMMLLAGLGGMRVLGLPGSARSPRPHGFDWVLQRLIAGIAVTGHDLMGMGVGGLLKEIPGRPMPREQAPAAREAAPDGRVAAVILGAGQSRRMGPVNKLLADIDGQPMVARTVDAALASLAAPVIVVLGHEADRVHTVLGDRKVTVVHNPDYASGLSSSLKRGLAALPDDIDGAVICLGDMPSVTAGNIDRLVKAFDPTEGRAICVPTFNGKRGNPVLWARRYFDDMAEVAGDVGARHLIGEHAEAVFEVAMPDGGVLLDLDTPEALAAHTAGHTVEG